MILWRSIRPAEPGVLKPDTVALPIDAAPGADLFDFEFPSSASVGGSTAGSPEIGAARDKAAAPAATRWNAAALAASLIFHAAAIAGFGALVAHEGLEAETDAISVEIVLEAAPQPAVEASVAGDANETRDAAAPAEGPEPGVEPVERLAAEAPSVAEADMSASDHPAVPAALPPFEPLPPWAQIEAPREQEDASSPAETTFAHEIDVIAAVPDFSPLAPLTAVPEVLAQAADEPAAIEHPVAGEPVEAEANGAREPVLAVAPSVESMLPAIEMPAPPRFPQPAETEHSEPAPSKQAAPAPRETDEQPVARKKPDKAPDRPKARKTEAKPAAPARTEKPARPKAEASDQPAGGSKSKGKPREATRAGAVASAAASSGDKEAYGRKVNRHVQRYKRYPEAAARGGMKGAVKVSISIGGSGNLASARVTGSSGYPVLDGEALATVRRAAPYPKPPAGFGNTARFSLTLRYSR